MYVPMILILVSYGSERPVAATNFQSSTQNLRRSCRGPKGHVNMIRVLDPASKVREDGVPNIMFCRILFVYVVFFARTIAALADIEIMYTSHFGRVSRPIACKLENFFILAPRHGHIATSGDSTMWAFAVAGSDLRHIHTC